MSGAPSLETGILGLVENIRSEMIALNQDLHELEINFASISVLEEKTNTMKDNITNLQQRVTHLEELINSSRCVTQRIIHLEELINSLSTKYIAFQQMSDKVDKMEINITALSKEMSVIKDKSKDFEEYLEEQAEKIKTHKSFYISIALIIIGAIISYFFK